MLLWGFFIGGDTLTSIKMLLSYNNNQKVIQLPVVPDNLPDILQELENNTITTHTKTLMLLADGAIEYCHINQRLQIPL